MSSTEPRRAETAHVGGRRPTPSDLVRELRDVAVAAPLAVTAPLLRRWHSRWGATAAEVSMPMPGDDLVPGCQVAWTRAITIAAPPDAVWPWLVQAGFGRAGFYSNDLLDNVGHPSADRIDPRLQRLHIGDWVPMFSKVDERTAFRVHSFEAPQQLVWSKPDSTWAWRLTPVQPSRTRLVTRIRQLYDWRSPGSALVTAVLMEFADFPMMRRMLIGIKERAEFANGS